MVAEVGAIGLLPPQPRLLHDVVGVRGRAEHLVGDGEQQAALGDEGVGGHVEATLGTASGGRSHDAENSAERMPSATLPRADMFIAPILAVSSSSAAGPRSA